MISKFLQHSPDIHENAFVHEHAVLIGQVSVGANSSIWPGVVLRGDMGRIAIGENTSIQDGSICHITEGLSETLVGNRVTVGHRVILHGCIVEDECLVGMGSILLDNCVIGKGSLIAAGALITAGKRIPPNSLVMGSPAKVIREVNDRERAMIDGGWRIYVEYAKQYK
jgi:carbonic anhydrase/acetyltransferase-like protein (isoleucine patch superfamily)